MDFHLPANLQRQPLLHFASFVFQQTRLTIAGRTMFLTSLLLANHWVTDTILQRTTDHNPMELLKALSGKSFKEPDLHCMIQALADDIGTLPDADIELHATLSTLGNTIKHFTYCFANG